MFALELGQQAPVAVRVAGTRELDGAHQRVRDASHRRDHDDSTAFGASGDDFGNAAHARRVG